MTEFVILGLETLQSFDAFQVSFSDLSFKFCADAELMLSVNAEA